MITTSDKLVFFTYILSFMSKKVIVEKKQSQRGI